VNKAEQEDEAPESPIPFPCSQSAYNPTGVYWNYEASPSAKARLQALLNRSSDEEDEPVRPPTPPENLTPALQLRLRPTLYREDEDRSPPPKFDPDKQLAILEDLRALKANMEAEKAEKAAAVAASKTAITSPPPRARRSGANHPSSSRSRKESLSADLFADDSADNSFLIHCTQAAEKAHFKPETASTQLSVATQLPETVPTQLPPPPQVVTKPQPTVDKVTKPQQTVGKPKQMHSAKSPAFDDDDEFDMLLSQMPDDPKTPKAPSRTAVTSVTAASWRRNHSSPEATTTSGALVANQGKVKLRHQTESSVASAFNKELAERRKREAIERRENKRRAAAAAAATAAEAAALPPKRHSASISSTSSTSIKSATVAVTRSMTTVIQPPQQAKMWSKEDNEKKRQEALRKRQMSQARKDMTKRK